MAILKSIQKNPETIKTNEDLEVEEKLKIDSKIQKESSEVKTVDSINPQNEIYSDKVIGAVKRVLIEDRTLFIRSIKFIQEGTRLIMYQGLKSNIYGVIEARLDGTYKIRIHNSFLLRQLKMNPITKDIFEGLLWA